MSALMRWINVRPIMFTMRVFGQTHRSAPTISISADGTAKICANVASPLFSRRTLVTTEVLLFLLLQGQKAGGEKAKMEK